LHLELSVCPSTHLGWTGLDWIHVKSHVVLFGHNFIMMYFSRLALVFDLWCLHIDAECVWCLCPYLSKVFCYFLFQTIFFVSACSFGVLALLLASLVAGSSAGVGAAENRGVVLPLIY